MNPAQPPHPPSAGGPWHQSAPPAQQGPPSPYGQQGPPPPYAQQGPPSQYAQQGSPSQYAQQGPPAPFARPARVPRKPGTAVTILLILGALIVGGLGGGVPGAVAGYVTSQPDGPTAPPSMRPEFPDAARRYLPDLKVADLADHWLVKPNGYRCAPSDVPTRRSEAKNRMSCEPTEEGLSAVDAVIEYDGDAQLQYVEVTCDFKPGANYCKTLFAKLGDAIFPRRPELGKQAEEWAGKNVDGDNISTTIGGVRFTVELSPHHMTVIPDA